MFKHQIIFFPGAKKLIVAVPPAFLSNEKQNRAISFYYMCAFRKGTFFLKLCLSREIVITFGNSISKSVRS